MSECSICARIEKTRRGDNPHLIHEFEHSFFVVGDHQFFPGYSLLILKRHARELHEFGAPEQRALFAELMLATNAIVKTFKPWKMNHACYGNLDPHVHWHLFPRYDTMPDHKTHPWKHSDEFEAHRIDAEEAREIAAKIRAQI